MCTRSSRSFALSIGFYLLVTSLLFPTGGYPQEFRLLLKYEVTDRKFVYLPVLAEICDQGQEQTLSLSGITGTDGRRRKISIQIQTDSSGRKQGYAELFFLPEDENESEVETDELELKARLQFSEVGENYSFYWEDNEAEEKSVVGRVNAKNAKVNLIPAEDEAVLLAPGMLWAILEAENEHRSSSRKQVNLENHLCGEGLSKSLANIALDDSLSIADAMKYTEANSTAGISPKINPAILPVDTLPLRNIAFPQVIKNIVICQNNVVSKDHGTINLLTYSGMPERGALIGGFELRDKSASADRGTRYVMRIAFPDNASDEIRIDLFPDTKTTSEETVYSAKCGEYTSVTIKKNGNYIISGREFNTDKGKLDLPNAEADNLENELVDRVNFATLLHLASLLREQAGQDEQNFSEVEVTEAIENLFTQEQAANQTNYDDGVVLDEWGIGRMVIPFSDSSIRTRVIFGLSDDLARTVFGPIYLHTPEGYGQYIIHIAQFKDESYEVLRFRSNSPEEVHQGLIRSKMTGLPYCLDFIQVIIEPTPGLKGNKAIRVAISTSHRKENLGVFYAGDWPDKSIDYLNFGEIIEVLAKASINPDIFSPPLMAAPETFFSFIRKWSVLPKRDFQAIPHWRGALTRYPVFFIKAPGKLAGALWREKERVAAGAVGAIAAGSIYYLATNPEFTDGLLDYLPSSTDVFEATFPMVRDMFQRMGLGAYCPPPVVEFDEEQCMRHVRHATARIMSDQGKSGH